MGLQQQQAAPWGAPWGWKHWMKCAGISPLRLHTPTSMCPASSSLRVAIARSVRGPDGRRLASSAALCSRSAIFFRTCHMGQHVTFPCCLRRPLPAPKSVFLLHPPHYSRPLPHLNSSMRLSLCHPQPGMEHESLKNDFWQQWKTAMNRHHGQSIPFARHRCLPHQNSCVTVTQSHVQQQQQVGLPLNNRCVAVCP